MTELSPLNGLVTYLSASQSFCQSLPFSRNRYWYSRLSSRSSVMEKRVDGEYLRELQVDLAHPKDFDLTTDV